MFNTKKTLIAAALMTALCAATALAADADNTAKDQFKNMFGKHHAEMQQLRDKHHTEMQQLRQKHWQEAEKLHGQTCKEDGCKNLKLHFENHKEEIKAEMEKHRAEMKANFEKHHKEMQEKFGKDCGPKDGFKGPHFKHNGDDFRGHRGPGPVASGECHGPCNGKTADCTAAK